MAPLFLYAFGPNDSFFFYCSIRTIDYNTSHAFKTTVLPRFGVPYSISFGPGPNEYCAFYESKEGELWRSLNYPHTKIFQPLYQIANDAVAKVLEEGQDYSKCQLVLGPARTYLFLAPGFPARFGPESFDNKVANREVNQAVYQKLLEKVEACNKSDEPEEKIVAAAIGYKGAWLVQLADGRLLWNFGPNCYTELIEFLRRGPCNVDHLALSPDSPEHYFLVYDRTKVKYSLPARAAYSVEPLLIEYACAVKTVSSEALNTTQGPNTASTSTAAQVAPVAAASDAPPAYSSTVTSAQGQGAAQGTKKHFVS